MALPLIVGGLLARSAIRVAIKYAKRRTTNRDWSPKGLFMSGYKTKTDMFNRLVGKTAKDQLKSDITHQARRAVFTDIRKSLMKSAKR